MLNYCTGSGQCRPTCLFDLFGRLDCCQHHVYTDNFHVTNIIVSSSVTKYQTFGLVIKEWFDHNKIMSSTRNTTKTSTKLAWNNGNQNFAVMLYSQLYSQRVLPLTATKIWRINININTASDQQYHAPAPDELWGNIHYFLPLKNKALVRKANKFLDSRKETKMAIFPHFCQQKKQQIFVATIKHHFKFLSAVDRQKNVFT